MIAVPKWLMIGTTCAIAAYSLVFAGIVIAGGRLSVTAFIALALYIVAFLLCLTGRSDERLALWRTVVATGVGVLLPVLGSVGLDPTADSYSTGAWYVAAVGALIVQLMWRRRTLSAWVVAGVLVVHTYAWGGLEALVSFAVIAAVLIMAVATAGGWAVVRAQRELDRYAGAEREALEWHAAQEAYHQERQVRLATTGDLAAPLLQRIVDAGGDLSEADRFECRVLEQTIRDEIRGRHLLNDALREQVILHRRRGATVQVNDDGGLDDLAPALVEPLITRVAEAITGLTSDRIIIRTAPRDSAKALSVVAMSTDPVAAALGLDDDEERVDLWLELDRPAGAATR